MAQVIKFFKIGSLNISQSELEKICSSFKSCDFKEKIKITYSDEELEKIVSHPSIKRHLNFDLNSLQNDEHLWITDIT